MVKRKVYSVSLNENMPAAPPADIVVARVVDARDLRCPLPLLRLRQALREVAVGDLLELQATDAGSVRDIAAYARLSGNTLEAYLDIEGTYRYWVRRLG